MRSSQLKLAGKFPPHQEYQAKMLLPEGLRELLQDVLSDSRLPEDGENPEVLADWSCYQFDSQVKRLTHVCFFRDGSDYQGEDDEDETDYMGVLFCRCDQEFSSEGYCVVWRVHIPDDQHQRVLLAASDYAHEFRTTGSSVKLDVIQSYLLSIIQNQSAWGEIDINFSGDEAEMIDLPAVLVLLDARFERLEQENRELRQIVRQLQEEGRLCWNCKDLFPREELKNGICKSCEVFYVHCSVCDKWLEREEARTHRHLFLADGDWLGSGGRDIDSHLEQQMKTSLFVLLDNWTDVSMLIHVIQRLHYYYDFGFYGPVECPESVVCFFSGSQPGPTNISFEHLSKEIRASMSLAIQWIATLDGAKTATANRETLTWISEWQETQPNRLEEEKKDRQ